MRKGDIDWAFDTADAIVEGVYRPQAIEQMPLETQVAVAVPEASGRLTIYSCTQAMYFSMGVVAAHLAGAAEQAEVRRRHGRRRLRRQGRHRHGDDLRAARAQGARPVKWRWTREEEFLVLVDARAVAHGDRRRRHQGRLDPRPADAHAARRRRVRALLAVRRHEARVPPLRRVHDPESALRRVRLLHEPRADDGDARLRRHVGLVRGRDAHEPNRRGDGDRPVGAPAEEREPDRRHDRQRRRPQGSLDGAGDPGGRRARRRRAGRGLRTMTPEPRSGDMLPRAPRGAAAPDRRGGTDGAARGRGFATIEYPTGMNQNGDPSQAWIKLKPDGRVDVFSGTVDVGQGSKTVHSQIVADTLGVPYDWVTMDNTNTDSSAVCTGTFASRGTFIGGNAVRRAAERVRERILDIASKELEIDAAGPDDRGRRGRREGRAAEEDRRRRRRGAATYNYGELISGSSTALKPVRAIVDDRDRPGRDRPPHSAISYAACVAEVEVDDETGEVVVEKLVQVYDVGRAINPTLVEGQIEGGAIMGLGLGLLEESYPYYPSVEHRGGEFGSYLGPALQDLPELDNVILENPSADGPFGAKAIGEMANNAQPPAIANAIYDAVGVWVTEMPATPERVLRALGAKGAGRAATASGSSSTSTSR